MCTYAMSRPRGALFGVALMIASGMASLSDELARLKDRLLRQASNAVTQIGRRMLTGRLLGGLTGTTPGAFAPGYIGWGTGTTAATNADTALQTPANEARVATANSQTTTSSTNDTFQSTATITSLSGQTISEAGLFDAAGTGTPPTGGNLALHGVFTGLALNIGDSVAFTATIQISS